MIEWILAHRTELAEVAGLAWLLLSAVVALTPTRRDDAWLARVAQRLSFLAPRNAKGRLSCPGKLPPALALLLAIGLSGCAGQGATIARSTAQGGAMVVVTADSIVATEYDRLTRQCDTGERDDCADRLRRLDRAERALGSLVHALRALDTAILAGQAARHCEMRDVLGAVLRSSREVALALTEAGLDVPEQVAGFLELASVLAGTGECVS